jgi:hypothetical protein
MQPVDLETCQLVCFSRARSRLHDTVQNIPVKSGRPQLCALLRFDAFGYELVSYSATVGWGRGRR